LETFEIFSELEGVLAFLAVRYGGVVLAVGDVGVFDTVKIGIQVREFKGARPALTFIFMN
jgi:hypothetical protein